MILIGLTGGIASGKSTVARLLRERGAAVIDADVIAEEVRRPGGEGFDAIVARFGPEILADNGEIDRRKLGARVFRDDEARLSLQAITHPLIYAEIVDQIKDLAGTHEMVVVDAALLVETLPDRGRALGLDALVVVAADSDVQLDRLARDRGMTSQDAALRIAAQAPIEKKLAVADYIIDNRGSLEDLEDSVDLLWNELTGAAKSDGR